MELLYQADVTGRPPDAVMAEWLNLGREVAPYTLELVQGFLARQEEIDAMLSGHSEEWSLSRMAAVDRTLLRVACYELLAGMPAAVAINEAVEAANELSTERSGRFVNGILGGIARDIAEGEAAGGTRPA